MKKSFLLLQGVSSPFFSELGKRLRAEGHHVSKLNFTVGDLIYWRGGGTTHFRRKSDHLSDFYENLFDEIDHCTDIVLFGDCRPVHQAAITGARRRGKQIHVFEEGYFRPYWITLERDGVNAASKLPRDPDWYKDVGKLLPHYRNGQPFESSFFIRAWHDVVYHSFGMWNPVLYPGYRTHAPYSALTEYAGYIRRAATLWTRTGRDNQAVEQLASEQKPYYFVPLQLDSDAQIRDHSPFKNMAEAMATIMASFARHAPSNSKLVVKNHPLDPGMTNYGRLFKLMERDFDIGGRVVYLETGHLPTLLDHCRGTITVNSTVGASSLVHKRSTITLADPIYNLRGLTFQGGLDEFWRNGPPPDMSLFKRFRNTVIHTTQINGGFYSRSGISMAVENAIPSLTADQSPLETLL